MRSAVFSPDGAILASASRDMTVRMWDLANPTAPPRILRGHKDAVRCVAYSPDGTLLEELQHNLVITHAVSVGKPFAPDVVRAMLAIRINTLMRGHSGIRVSTLQALVELLNRDIVPVIPEKGSVGASGDLSPLSHLAIVLLGGGEAFFRGERMSGADALERAALAALRERKPDRVLETNVEFWSAVVLDFAEVPSHMFTSMFTCARVAGWSAHILEQKKLGRLVRPAAKYVGPAPRKPSDVEGWELIQH